MNRIIGISQAIGGTLQNFSSLSQPISSLPLWDVSLGRRGCV